MNKTAGMRFFRIFYPFVLLFVLSVTALYGVNVSDPNDDLYGWIDVWYSRGYLRSLPAYRPYPIQYLKKVLETVEKTARTPEDREKAEEYAALFKKKFGIDLSFYGNSLFSTRSTPYLFSEAAVEPFLNLGLFTGSLKFGPGGYLNKNPVYPANSRNLRTLMEDSTWNVPAGNTRLYGGFASNTLLSVGNDFIFFQGGIHRNAYGPFTGDSIVLSSSAREVPTFSLTYTSKYFTFSNVFMGLLAHLGNGPFRNVPGKFLMFRSYEITPLDWLSFRIFESTLFGGRFAPIYFVPFAPMFLGLVHTGTYDNGLMGASLTVKFPLNFRLDTTLYMDDFNFKGMLKNALQVGLNWSAPGEKAGFISRAALDYTLVGPFMYTHRWENNLTGGSNLKADEQINYLDYIHDGENLAVNLEPNSGRLRFMMDFNFPFRLKINLVSMLIHHGNASGGQTGSGDLYDNGWLQNAAGKTIGHLFNDASFLGQDVLETVFRQKIGLRYTFLWDKAGIALSPFLDYVFQYTWNRDLVKGQNGADHFVNAGLSFRYRF